MLSKNLNKALNEQVNFEFQSSYDYIAMEIYFKEKGLDGFANYFHVQALEERLHAYMIMDYINRTGGKVELAAIHKPNTKFSCNIEVLKDALAHEEAVTKSIYRLTDMAIDENNHSARNFLNQFIAEQDEEEEQARNLLEKMQMIGDDPSGIFLIDSQLKLRTSSELNMEQA